MWWLHLGPTRRSSRRPRLRRGRSLAEALGMASQAIMSTHIKRWLVGFVIGMTGMALAWSGYKPIGLIFGWVGWGIAAYGLGGGIIERVRQAKN